MPHKGDFESGPWVLQMEVLIGAKLMQSSFKSVTWLLPTFPVLIVTISHLYPCCPPCGLLTCAWQVSAPSCHFQQHPFTSPPFFPEPLCRWLSPPGGLLDGCWHPPQNPEPSLHMTIYFSIPVFRALTSLRVESLPTCSREPQEEPSLGDPCRGLLSEGIKGIKWRNKSVFHFVLRFYAHRDFHKHHPSQCLSELYW